MKSMKEMLGEIQGNLQKFSSETPEQMQGFQGFMEAAEKDGAVSSKTKHLMAIACAVVSHCDWCISFHVKGALDKGASKEEIMESAWVGVLMGGGPALMYSQYVLKAVEEMAE